MTREELRDYVEEQRNLDIIPYHVYSTLIDGIDTLEQQPCEDAISREDAIKTAIESADDWDGGYNLTRADIIEKAIKSLPSVQPKAKTGYWECNELFGDGEIQFANIRCSECGNEMRISPYRYNRLHELEKYCSVCGCKMEG